MLCATCAKCVWTSRADQLYCSQPCRDWWQTHGPIGKRQVASVKARSAAGRPPRPCATCARVFTPKRRPGLFCSDRCRQWWADRDPAANRRKFAKKQARPVEFDCGWCGRPAVGTWGSTRSAIAKHGVPLCGECGKGRPGRIGCEPCPALPHPSPSASPVRIVVRPSCGWCGTTIRTNGTLWCSELCRQSQYRPTETTINYAECAECGATFIRRAGQLGRFCSLRCRRKPHKRHRRRLLGDVDKESVALREIAERDGWRCHLCGKKVPDRPWSADPLDPTLDHLIPVSAGGSHTRDNLALAHNRCNYERGAEGAAQLRLVG